MANRYWVGGTASWDATAGTKWALTSGGAGGQAVPTSADNVFFDAASGVVTVTIAATVNCLNLSCTGYTGTIAGSSALNVYSNITLVSGMTWSHTGFFTMRATSGTSTITSAGKVFGALALNGIGGTFQLADNFNTSGTFSITNGTFDPNGKNFNYSYGGGGSLTIAGTTYYNLSFSGTAGNIKVFVSGSSLTVTGTLSSTNTYRLRFIKSTALTITAAAVSLVRTDFAYVTAAGTANWNLSAITGGAGDLGNNTGITFTTPVTRYWVGNAGTWNSTTTTNWSATSGGTGGATVPLPQDTAIFNASSFSLTAQSVSITAETYVRNVDCSAVTNNPTMATGPINVVGNYVGGTLTIASGYPAFFGPGSSHNYNPNGATFTLNPCLDWASPNVTVNLTGNLYAPTRDPTWANGGTSPTLNIGNFDVTVESLTVAGSTSVITTNNGNIILLGTSTSTTAYFNILNILVMTSTGTGGLVLQNGSVGPVIKPFNSANGTFARTTVTGDNIRWDGTGPITNLALNNAGAANGFLLGTGTKSVGAITTNGSAGNLIKIKSDVPATARLIQQTNNNPLFLDYANMTDIAGVGNEGNYITANTSSASSSTFSMSTLTVGATSLTLTDDSAAAAAIGFNFAYFGINYTSINVGSNGLLGLGYSATSANGEYSAVLDSGSWSNIIAGVWSDYDPSLGGTIKYETLGTAPNRTFVVEYVNIPDFNTPTAKATFQIKLFETSNNIEVHVQSAATTQFKFVQGICGINGANTASVSGRKSFGFSAADLSNEAVLFTQSATAVPYANYIEYYARNSTDGGNNANWRFATRPSNLFLGAM